MNEDITPQNLRHDYLDNNPIDSLTKLQTAILEALFNELLAGIRTAWTLDDIGTSFPSVSGEELLQSIKGLEAGDVITVVWSPAEAGDRAVIKTTPQGFADYVQHFRPDIEANVAVIANAITSANCKSVIEISQHTDISCTVVAQVLRYFKFEGWLVLDPNNEESILTVDGSLETVYGS